ncbi:MAG: hypothetical protein P1Q69_18760, partial [Candidatus Thorarchaeota archaeon]|nr:hypothetical protein [Candidatus Thorarchaeota archaeon]
MLLQGLMLAQVSVGILQTGASVLFSKSLNTFLADTQNKFSQAWGIKSYAELKAMWGVLTELAGEESKAFARNWKILALTTELLSIGVQIATITARIG